MDTYYRSPYIKMEYVCKKKMAYANNDKIKMRFVLIKKVCKT